MIQPERIRRLADGPPGRGRYVLYWMQQSQRADCNHALELAVRMADDRRLPLLVCFGLAAGYPGATARHYRFMLEGLDDVRGSLGRRGIGLVIRPGEPWQVAAGLAGGAALVVTDCGYTRIQREWRRRLAAEIGVPLLQVESDVVVPVETACPKAAWSAVQIRKRLRPLLAAFLQPLEESGPDRPSLDLADGMEQVQGDAAGMLAGLDLPAHPLPLPLWRGGGVEARARLARFLEGDLDRYAELARDPAADCLSGLGPHLHFGQISPLEVALAVSARGGPGAAPFLEQLIVRRELAVNFVWHTPGYDRYEGVPAWARAGLRAHAADRREYLYPTVELESAATHDRYWNASQKELLATGRIHGYMRMYWGKKLIEWSESPQQAYATAVRLNDAWQLDGRDPNGYAGIGWCFGLHDRPWASRPVLGPVRSMTAAGLERKFDIGSYAARVEERYRQWIRTVEGVPVR